MPPTALKHFNEDMDRAKAILVLATNQPHGTPASRRIRDDLFRSAWMFGVGALDAYFCDAYSDLVARTLQAKNKQSSFKLTGAVSKITFPVGAIFSTTKTRENWRWRSAARDLMEKDSVLSFYQIKSLINPFLSQGQKFLENEVIDSLIVQYDARQGLTGITRPEYRKLTGKQKSLARDAARKKIVQRIDSICQRRNDCIHNCDRPKQALQRIGASPCKYALRDIDLLVRFSDAHIETEYKQFLVRNGANTTTRNAGEY